MRFTAFLAFPLLVSQVGALWSQTVTVTLTGVGPNVLSGVYTAPYFATIKSVNTAIVSDDFLTDVFPPESWARMVKKAVE